MSRRNRGTVPETEAERALAELARQRFVDYQTRWLPVQMESAARLGRMHQEGSFERGQAKAMFGAETARAFTDVERGIEQRNWAAGVNPGSARAKLQSAGIQADRAAATGIGWSRADQIIEDAYVRGLSSLMAAGRGQRAATFDSAADAARLAQQSALSDAMASAADRAAAYQIAGSAIGFGARYYTDQNRPRGISDPTHYGYPSQWPT